MSPWPAGLRRAGGGQVDAAIAPAAKCRRSEVARLAVSVHGYRRCLSASKNSDGDRRPSRSSHATSRPVRGSPSGLPCLRAAGLRLRRMERAPRRNKLLQGALGVGMCPQAPEIEPQGCPQGGDVESVVSRTTAAPASILSVWGLGLRPVRRAKRGCVGDRLGYNNYC